MTIRLCQEALPMIAGAVSVPAYDRSRLRAGILHFGVGNFHRAHMAAYLDALFATGADHDWAIIGTGVMASDARVLEILAAQDFLTTVVEQEAQASTARVTGAMVGAIMPGDTDGVLAALTDPSIRIVSVTITEGGYYVDPATGTFNPAHADMVADAARPDRPSTVFGLIVAGLRRRREAGVVPFTVLSCDNLPHNGAVTRNAVAGLAELTDADLATWIRREVAFPNGMVDRITPATGERERRMLADEFNIEDGWPVFCEGFSQWVLEDHFPAGRPALERVGVQFVPDVAPFETMKIRILNGGHAVIAYAGGLLDIAFVHEAMEHPLVAAFLEKVEREEIIPVVPPVPDTSLDDYLELVIRRFANPKIGDTVRRLCLDGSNRQPKFIIPSIADRLERGLDIEGLALVSALWCRYCFGVTDSGAPIEPNDPDWARLQAHARLAKTDPMAWLDMRDVYGDVGNDERFRSAFLGALTALWHMGTAPTLERYLVTGSASVRRGDDAG